MRISRLVAVIIGASLSALGCGFGVERESHYADPPAESYRVTSLAVRVNGAGDGQPRTIVGVGPPGFAPHNTRIWLPGQ